MPVLYALVILMQLANTPTGLLKKWAGDKDMIMAAFFFWHLGTPEQKTKDGLFRGLLYTILNADPSLIPLLLPEMWQEAYSVVTWRERQYEEDRLMEEVRQQSDDHATEEPDQGASTREEEEQGYIQIHEINRRVKEKRSHAATALRTLREGRKDLNHRVRPILKFPSTRDMVEAFQRLKREQTRHKFCFFIDGLDEYAGDLLSGTDIILSLASNDNRGDSDKIKIIVSSRPIPACVQAFSGKKKLQLHDVTRGDIEAYVDDTIRSHGYIEKIIAIDEPCVSGILSDLVEKASGVFLWVVLACRSLLEGFAAYDYPQELRRRVDELPPELELLFKHMLDKMEKRYQRLAAKLLRVCYQARLNEDARRQAWAADPTAPRRVKVSEDDETVLGLSTIGLALLDEYGFDLERPPAGRALSGPEIYAKCEMFDARLRSRCCGLLETRRLETLADSTVEFMHRSVFEFLSSENVLDLPCLQVDEGTSRFEPNAVLSRMYLHVMPLARHSARLKVCASGSLVSLRYSTAGAQARMSMLQQFSRVTFEMIQDVSDGEPTLAFFKQITGHFPKPNRKSETTLALLLAAELGMTELVLRHAATCPEPSRTPLLYHAVGRPYTRCLPIWRLPIPPEMIRHLLSGPVPRCSPNGRFNNSGDQLTPWTCWLRHMQQSKIDTEPASAFEEVTRLFVEAGADVTARLPNGVVHKSLESLIRWRILEAGSEITKGEVLGNSPAHPLAERCDQVLRMVEARRCELQNRSQGGSWVGQCIVS